MAVRGGTYRGTAGLVAVIQVLRSRQSPRSYLSMARTARLLPPKIHKATRCNDSRIQRISDHRINLVCHLGYRNLAVADQWLCEAPSALLYMCG